jgi:hypothetical protein
LLVTTNQANLKNYNIDITKNFNINNTYYFNENYTFIKNSKIPNLKNGIIDKNTLEELEKEYYLFDIILDHNETFLLIDDYTTQSARYFLYNKKIPTKSHSILNVTNIESQIQELENFKQDNVKIVRISNGLMRYYIFYDYFINGVHNNKYVYTIYNEKEYLIESEKFDQYKDIIGLIELEMPLLSKLEFGFLPIKWGKKLEPLENLVEEKININIISSNQVDVKGNKIIIQNTYDPFIVIALEDEINGNNVDYVRMNIESTNRTFFRGNIYWKNKSISFNENDKVGFNLSSGNIIVPIGMNLNWKLTNNITHIRIDFDNMSEGDIITINNISFLQLEYLNKTKDNNFLMDRFSYLTSVSNISDANWVKGIKDGQDILLFNYNDKNKRLLNVGNTFSSNGLKFQITEVNNINNEYFYVKLDTFNREALCYPNLLSFKYN